MGKFEIFINGIKPVAQRDVMKPICLNVHDYTHQHGAEAFNGGIRCIVHLTDFEYLTQVIIHSVK